MAIHKIPITGQGSSIVVDEELSSTSENPVQNKVITTYLNQLTAKVTALENKFTLKITKQPEDTTILSGLSGRLSVTATGFNLKYQWYNKWDGGAAAITGATNNYYQPSFTGDVGTSQQYLCEITDGFGTTVSTNIVTVTIANLNISLTDVPATVSRESNYTVNVAVIGRNVRASGVLKTTTAQTRQCGSFTDIDFYFDNPEEVTMNCPADLSVGNGTVWVEITLGGITYKSNEVTYNLKSDIPNYTITATENQFNVNQISLAYTISPSMELPYSVILQTRTTGSSWVNLLNINGTTTTGGNIANANTGNYNNTRIAILKDGNYYYSNIVSR